ncbi:hypothetical protein D3C87_2147620 [compost metagenome]
MLASSNILGSVISLTSNFIAGGALIAMLSPFSFSQGIAVLADGEEDRRDDDDHSAQHGADLNEVRQH